MLSDVKVSVVILSVILVSFNVLWVVLLIVIMLTHHTHYYSDQCGFANYHSAVCSSVIMLSVTLMSVVKAVLF
jgi:hypothetical protein